MLCDCQVVASACRVVIMWLLCGFHVVAICQEVVPIYHVCKDYRTSTKNTQASSAWLPPVPKPKVQYMPPLSSFDAANNNLHHPESSTAMVLTMPRQQDNLRQRATNTDQGQRGSPTMVL